MFPPIGPFTLIIIVITSGISVISFNNSSLFGKLMLNPYQVIHRKEYYRVISHAFVHADWLHLIVNMIVLYSFGTAIENHFRFLEMKEEMQNPIIWYAALYTIGIIISSIPSILKHKNNWNYNSVGASGAVSAVLFCCIFFYPTENVKLYAAIPIPSIIFGVLYLVYSQYMSKKSNDNINHDAHITGALFGFTFPIIIDYHYIQDFINQILSVFN